MRAAAPANVRRMKLRSRAGVAGLALVAAGGCASASSGTGATPTPTPTQSTSAAPSATTSSSTPTPSPTATTSGGRLAFVAKKNMFVVRVSSTGRTVGPPGLLGPADATSQPRWSPLGRYLVWTWNDENSRSENPAVFELYDTTTGKLHESRNLNIGDVTATGTGAQVVEFHHETSVADVFYNNTGGQRTAGEATFKQVVNVIAAGQRGALVETGDSSGNSGKPASLWLLPQTGPRVRLSTIQTLHFLGADVPPALGWHALAADGIHAAYVTGLGQDGACADGQSVHLVDLAAKTDVAVALPYKDGDLRTPSYSPLGVLGGILDECGSEGPDTHNAFVEMQGSSWTTVVPGATIGARGPGGLLAVQLGTLPKRDYGVYVSPDHPLQIRTAAGKVMAGLPTATAVAWTQAATPPKA
jgi:hypothetical protein